MNSSAPLRPVLSRALPAFTALALAASCLPSAQAQTGPAADPDGSAGSCLYWTVICFG